MRATTTTGSIRPLCCSTRPNKTPQQCDIHVCFVCRCSTQTTTSCRFYRRATVPTAGSPSTSNQGNAPGNNALGTHSSSYALGTWGTFSIYYISLCPRKKNPSGLVHEWLNLRANLFILVEQLNPLFARAFCEGASCMNGTWDRVWILWGVHTAKLCVPSNAHVATCWRLRHVAVLSLGKISDLDSYGLQALWSHELVGEFPAHCLFHCAYCQCEAGGHCYFSTCEVWYLCYWCFCYLQSHSLETFRSVQCGNAFCETAPYVKGDFVMDENILVAGKRGHPGLSADFSRSERRGNCCCQFSWQLKFIHCRALCVISYIQAPKEKCLRRRRNFLGKVKWPEYSLQTLCLLSDFQAQKAKEKWLKCKTVWPIGAWCSVKSEQTWTLVPELWFLQIKTQLLTENDLTFLYFEQRKRSQQKRRQTSISK